MLSVGRQQWAYQSLRTARKKFNEIISQKKARFGGTDLYAQICGRQM
jgi:hypothetical protein